MTRPAHLAPPATRDRRRRGAGRLTWIVVSQGLSSLSNFGLTVVVARAVDQDTFGWFAIAFGFYGMTLSIARAAVAQPLTIRFAADREGRRDAATSAAAAAVAVGAAGSLTTLTASVVVALMGGSPAAFVVTGVFLPAVVLQDLLRHAFFTEARPHRAAHNDLVWIAVQVVLVAIVIALFTPTVPLLIAAWGVAAVVAAVFGLFQLGHPPAWREAVPYLRQHRDLGGTLTFVTVLYVGTNYLVFLFLGPIVSVAGVGALRGTNALFGPYYLLVSGMQAAGPAEAGRVFARDPRRLLPLLRRASAALGVCALAMGGVLAVLPDRLGEAVLGDTWAAAVSLIPAFTASAVAHSAAVGGLVGLRIIEAKRDLVHTSLASNGMQTAFALIGALLYGIEGAAWGLASGGVVALAVTWTALTHHLHAVSRPPAEAAA